MPVLQAKLNLDIANCNHRYSILREQQVTNNQTKINEITSMQQKINSSLAELRPLLDLIISEEERYDINKTLNSLNEKLLVLNEDAALINLKNQHSLRRLIAEETNEIQELNYKHRRLETTQQINIRESLLVKASNLLTPLSYESSAP